MIKHYKDNDMDGIQRFNLKNAEVNVLLTQFFVITVGSLSWIIKFSYINSPVTDHIHPHFS